MIADSRISVQPGLAEAVRRSQDYFLRTQHPDGYWVGELETNVCMAAEYLLLTHFLGVRDEERWRKIATFLLREQRPDGTWAIYFSGPPDINATVESYFALKLAGVSPDDPGMRKARQWVLSVGGVPKTRVFTKIWLALLGQWDWRGVPVLPPELMFLPHWFPLNIYDFASWARATIVPMLIILSERPACPVPDYARIDELYPGATTRVGNRIGAGDREGAQRSAWVALGLGATVMGAFALVFVAGRRVIPAAFGAGAEVVATTAAILPIVAAFELFDGLQVVGGGVLRGMGRTRPAAAFNFIGYYVLGMPLAVYFGRPDRLGLQGIWWGLAAGLFAVAVAMVAWVAVRGPRTVPALVSRRTRESRTAG